MFFGIAMGRVDGGQGSSIARRLGAALVLAACLSANVACSTDRRAVGGGSGRPEKTSETSEGRTKALEASPQPDHFPEKAEVPTREEGKRGADWNDSQVEWLPAKDGFAKARRTKTPICLVVFTTWCPHCTAYSQLFKDARVVQASKSLVMIRIDADRDEALSKEYALDGEYIPRTLFLSPEGKPDAAVRASSGEYGYYYEESDPASLLAAMQRVARRSKTELDR
jgi:hypothetical protein